MPCLILPLLFENDYNRIFSKVKLNLLVAEFLYTDVPGMMNYHTFEKVPKVPCSK